MLIAFSFFLIADFLSQSLISISSENQIIYQSSAKEFSTRFIHSVQLTPVEEFFIVDDDKFILKSTKYQSFGVGLPFLQSDGNFRCEGDYFILDDINRPINQLYLRTGVGTNLTLNIDNRSINLYELVADGSLIEIKLQKRLDKFFELF